MQPVVSIEKEAQAGDVVDGRYALTRVLGSGAEGVVYEAVHVYTDQRVALKMLHPSAVGSVAAERRARLLREASILGRLKHPNIVTILDAVVTETSSFLALELLEGRTLESLIAARGQLSAVEAVTVILQACDAVAFAHRNGIIHRDIKPSNIIIVREAWGERIKVVDFGASRPASPDVKLTATGQIVGTPAYMAPEQFLADAEIDQRADVYALGAVMFECLTGKVVYPGNFADIVRSAFSNDGPPSVRDSVPGIALPLARVVQRAISASRDHRQSSVSQLIEELRLACPEASSHTNSLLNPPTAVTRRKYPRAPYMTPARVDTAAGPIDVRVQDISEGGLLVLTQTPAKIGELITVRFGLPLDGKVGKCKAYVRWVRGGEDDRRALVMGLEFHDMDETMRRSITVYVALMTDDGGGQLLGDDQTKGGERRPNIEKVTVRGTPAAIAALMSTSKGR